MGGGVRRESAFQCFSQKFAVLFARSRSGGGATSNNKPTRGRWEEGCRLHATRFARKKPSPYKIEGVGGRFGQGKRKNIIFHGGLNSVARRGVSNKKIRRRTPPGGATSSGTPRGRRHATTSGNLVIPAHKGGVKAFKGAGGGCKAMLGGGR